jgi:HK97 family phage prohead protease
MSASNQWETRYIDLESRAEVGDDKRIRGYPVVFSKLSEELLTKDGARFREVVMPHAVDRTLREGLDVRAYVDHDTGKILGRLRAGTLRIDKDARGLRAEIMPPSTSIAKDVMISIRRGDITGMSFRFAVVKPHGDEWRIEGGQMIRELHDIVISEVSIVTEPVYPDTDVAVRSLREFQETHRPAWKPSADLLRRQLKAKG